MVSENFAQIRKNQGCHGHLGGAFGDCEEAKNAGSRMGGKNDADRTDPGVRVPWINIEGNLKILCHLRSFLTFSQI